MKRNRESFKSEPLKLKQTKKKETKSTHRCRYVERRAYKTLFGKYRFDYLHTNTRTSQKTAKAQKKGLPLMSSCVSSGQ
jgi:hypothetical protein